MTTLTKKRTRPSLDYKLRLKLWTNAGGRCQYNGCNKKLNIDELTSKDLNKSYIAHIYAFAEGGPRFDSVLSPKLEKDFSNLMLMCDECHRRIDKEDINGHPADLLIKMKKDHENRILNLTEIKDNVKTHIVLYTSRIGKFEPTVNLELVRKMLADCNLYPITNPIDLGIKNGSIQDNEELYWIYEEKSLVDNFEKLLVKHFGGNGNNHFSLFALAPQPLLIKLGTLIPDLYAVDVYQKHREPDTWEWQKKINQFNGFIVNEPKSLNKTPVLKISLSANIDNHRIEKTCEEEVSIWELTIKNPHNNFLTSPEILQKFRVVVRNTLNRIKEVHGHDVILKLFPCMPNSASVEFGRVWMPKADLALEIYDERDGYKKALTIKRD
jgi:hypothetical protein